MPHNVVRKLLIASVAVALGALLQSKSHGQDKGVVPAALKQTELDQPIAWLQEAKRNFGAVKDYSCYMTSQENVNGKLLEKNVIYLRFKSEPFSIHMRWLEPKKSENQEVIYVHGKNNNKMRVKSNLLVQKLTGFVSVDVNDKRVTEHSRHTIIEAGIGNMIDQCLLQAAKDRELGKTKVAPVTEYSFAGRKCLRVELTRVERDAAHYCYRTVVYLEKESKMPIRMENYDWPRAGGPTGGELLEMFSYSNITFNSGLKDADFNK